MSKKSGTNGGADPNDLQHYDVHKSPFLELQTPFTIRWCHHPE